MITKLDSTIYDTYAMKINELVEAVNNLSDKEGGECKHLRTKIVLCSHIVECEDCNQAIGKFTRVSPPQQEESRGECESYETEYKGRMESEQTRYDAIVGKKKPQLKEESPKEDECFCKEVNCKGCIPHCYCRCHLETENKEGWEERLQSLAPFTYSTVHKFIKSNFVSRVKVNKEISIVLESEACEYDLAEKLLKNLGLEEL